MAGEGEDVVGGMSRSGGRSTEVTKVNTGWGHSCMLWCVRVGIERINHNGIANILGGGGDERTTIHVVTSCISTCSNLCDILTIPPLSGWKDMTKTVHWSQDVV